MFLRLVNARAKFVIISVVISLLIIGCKKKENTGESSVDSNSPIRSGFMLDFKELTKPQVLKSELFLKYVAIRQYHIGQQQPTEYSGRDISKITFYYVLFPNTKEWMLNKMDIHLKDGSVKSEHSQKAWNVALGMTSGNGQNPISIEQHFEPK
ncbi:MAG: hypothetical protein ACYSSN_12010 [Planctomycetota bacterium]|jgi:hypothetical protein